MTKADLAKAEQIQNALMYFELSTSTLNSDINELAKLAADDFKADLETLRAALNCVLTRLESNKACFK